MRVISFDIGCINFAHCLVDTDPKPHVVCMGKRNIGDAKSPMCALIDGMHAYLDSIPTMHDPHCDRIVIEQQNGHTAPKNFALSTALYSFFQAKFPGRVVFVNPRVKFTRLALMPEMSEYRDEIVKARGPALKKLSIKCATHLAEVWNCDVARTAIREAIKKDDISDCLLMAAATDLASDAPPVVSKKRKHTG
jgi:hypothetical protein